VSTENGAARHFGAAAEGYTKFRGRGLLGWIRRREQQAVGELCPAAAGALALDAGCGDGETLTWLAGRGAHAMGVDLSLPMAAGCAGRGHAVSVQDMNSLAFGPVFDWVLCIGSLEFVAHPQHALTELAQCLKPDGRLVLLYPRRGLLGALYTMYHRSHGTRIHTFRRPYISRMLADSGLQEPAGWRRCVLADVCVSRRVAR
jgi:SAM-dependent methyltransferase